MTSKRGVVLFILIAVFAVSIIETENVTELQSASVEVNTENDINISSEEGMMSSTENYDQEMYEETETETNPSYPNGLDIDTTLRTFIERVFKEALPYLNQYSGDSDISAECTGAMLRFILAIRRLETWALRMVDAMGRPPAGIFEGTITDFGAFDQCLEIKAFNAWDDEDFRGQYCPLFIKPNIDPSKPTKIFNGSPTNVTRILSSQWFPGFRLGICVPSACSHQDMDHLAKSVGKHYGVKASVPRCDTLNDLSLDDVQIAAVAFILIVVAAVIVGTFIDILLRTLYHKDEQQPNGLLIDVVLCWSAYSSTLRLFNVSPESSCHGTKWRSLHGLRFLTIFWIILGYSYALTPVPNRRFVMLVMKGDCEEGRIFDYINYVRDTPFMLIANAYPAADTFFFLSGLLFSVSVLTKLATTNRSVWTVVFTLFMRRYIRVMVPCLCLVLVFSLFPLISSGPLWNDNSSLLRTNCIERWWKIPLLANNYETSLESCLAHLWYFATDFQLLLIFSVTMVVIFRWRRIGWALLIGVIVVTTFYIAIQTYLQNLLPVTIYFAEDMQRSQTTHTEVFKRPFAHAGAFALGVTLGYGLLHAKDDRWRLNKKLLVGGWLAAIACALAVILGVADWHKGDLPNTGVTMLYAATHRTAWAIFITWVTFVCVTGQSEMIRRFLSWSPMVSLSRLSFSAYLLCILVIFARYGSIRERPYSSHFNQICDFIVIFVLSYTIGFIFHLLFEAPVMNLLNVFTNHARHLHLAHHYHHKRSYTDEDHRHLSGNLNNQFSLESESPPPSFTSAASFTQTKSPANGGPFTITTHTNAPRIDHVRTSNSSTHL